MLPSMRGSRYCVKVCIALLAVVLPLAAGEASDHAIVFAHGKDTASARGYFSSHVQEVYFSFSARDGQRLRVKIVPLHPHLSTAGVVIFPSGKQEGGPGGAVFDRELTETGIYRIRVTPRQGKGRGRFRVELRLSYPSA